MALQVPNRVREALGDEAIVEFIPWLQDLVREYSVPRDEYRQVLSRLDGMEKDISLIKEEQTKMRAEFQEGQAQLRAEFREGQAQLRGEFNELWRDVHQRFDEMGARLEVRFDDMNRQIVVQTRWFIGALTVLVTVVSALMAIVQFTP